MRIAWLARLAKAAQIRANDGEVPGEERRDPIPSGVGTWMAMQEEKRRAGTSASNAQRCFRQGNHLKRESFKHVRATRWAKYEGTIGTPALALWAGFGSS